MHFTVVLMMMMMISEFQFLFFARVFPTYELIKNQKNLTIDEKINKAHVYILRSINVSSPNVDVFVSLFLLLLLFFFLSLN